MTQISPIQRLAFTGIAVLGAVVAVSSLPGIWIGAIGWEAWGVGPQFLIAAFEALTLAAGITAVFIGLRAGTDGIGLGLLCVAGAIAVGAVLGLKMLQSSSDQVPPLRDAVLARLALAGLLVGLAGVVKLGTRADCWRAVLMGGLLLLPLGLIGALVVRKQTRLLTEPIGRLGEVAQMVVWLALAVAVGVLTVAGGHLVIRAFEMTRGPKDGAAKAE